MTKLKFAKLYIGLGFSLIPVGKDKKPLLNWKEFTTRRATLREVKEWLDEDATAGLGIVTGKISGITVVDVEAGGQYEYLPETKMVRTGGGGLHFYYKYNEKFKNAVRIRELTDIRNDGGYVVAPPSRHMSGRKYTWSRVGEFTDFPEHLFVTEAIKHQENKWEEILQGVGKGERNDAAAKVCGFFLTKIAQGIWEAVAWPAVKNWNTFNKPPLKETELRAVFDSISSRVTYKQDDIDREITDQASLIEQHKTKLKEIKSGVLRAVPSGFPFLDGYLNGGFKPGEFIIIVARPSIGKTSLALTFAENAAKNNFNVLFFSIEMSSLDLFERLLSFVTNIPASKIIKGDASEEALAKGYKIIEKLPIDIAELTKANSVEVIEIVKKRLLEKKVDLVIVDYIQLLRDKSKSDNSAQRVGQISKNMKLLARITGIPVICPAQLNRKAEDRKGGKPLMADLRESGDLEADADTVILISRDTKGDDKGKAKLILTKNRRGQTGEVQVSFDLRTTRFKE